MDLIKVMAVCRIAVITIGLMGNILTFIIFSRPSFKNNSISTYCRALAVFDCFVIYELISDIGFVFFDYFVDDKSNVMCKITIYAALAFSSISSWTVIAFSIDKVLSMKNKATFIKKRPFQYAVISGIVLFDLLLYIEVPIFISIDTKSNGTTAIFRCDIGNISFGSIITLVNLIEGSLIPFIIMIGSSIISIRLIRNSARNIRNHVNESSILNRTTRDFKYAITSVSFNIMFVLLKSPIIIVYVLKSYIPSVSTDTIFVSLLFYFINYSSGIFVHLVSNSIFRRDILIFLGLRKSNQVSYLNQTPNSPIN